MEPCRPCIPMRIGMGVQAYPSVRVASDQNPLSSSGGGVKARVDGTTAHNVVVM